MNIVAVANACAVMRVSWPVLFRSSMTFPRSKGVGGRAKHGHDTISAVVPSAAMISG
jgi:hypothetical protein